MAEGDVGGVVFEVLLGLDLVDGPAEGVEGVGVEGAAEEFVVALQEEHVLLEDAQVLEAGYDSEEGRKTSEWRKTYLCSRA